MTLFACSGQVIGLITTTINRLYLIRELAVAGTMTRKYLCLCVFPYLSGGIDVNRYLARRCSVVVVATEDTSLGGRRIVSTINNGVFYLLVEHNACCRVCDAFIHRHGNITIHVGHCRGVA